MRVIKWFVINAIFVALIYLGVYEGVEGAVNVVIAFAWLNFIASIVMFTETGQETLRDIINDKGIIVPRFISASLEFGIVLVFIWFGFIWTGIIYLVKIFLVMGALAESKKEELKV